MILSAIPKQFRAGDTWRLLLDLADYPSPTWSVVLAIENASSSKEFSATAGAGGAHSITVANTATAGVASGSYKWLLRATSGGVVETADEGWLYVLPSVSSDGKIDHRSWARRTLDALEATLEGKASADQLAMTIAGRSISRIPLPELLQWRTQLRSEVRTLEFNGTTKRVINVRLGRA